MSCATEQARYRTKHGEEKTYPFKQTLQNADQDERGVIVRDEGREEGEHRCSKYANRQRPLRAVHRGNKSTRHLRENVTVEKAAQHHLAAAQNGRRWDGTLQHQRVSRRAYPFEAMRPVKLRLHVNYCHRKVDAQRVHVEEAKTGKERQPGQTTHKLTQAQTRTAYLRRASHQYLYGSRHEGSLAGTAPLSRSPASIF